MPDNKLLTGAERGPLVERFIGEFGAQFFMKDFVYMNVKFHYCPAISRTMSVG